MHHTSLPLHHHHEDDGVLHLVDEHNKDDEDDEDLVNRLKEGEGMDDDLVHEHDDTDKDPHKDLSLHHHHQQLAHASHQLNQHNGLPHQHQIVHTLHHDHHHHLHPSHNPHHHQIHHQDMNGNESHPHNQNMHSHHHPSMEQQEQQQYINHINMGMGHPNLLPSFPMILTHASGQPMGMIPQQSTLLQRPLTPQQIQLLAMPGQAHHLPISLGPGQPTQQTAHLVAQEQQYASAESDDHGSGTDDKPRKTRWRPTQEQKQILESVWQENPYPEGQLKNQIVKQFNGTVTYQQITSWFKHRRENDKAKGKFTYKFSPAMKFTNEQIHVLETAFVGDPYAKGKALMEVSHQLGVNLKRVQNWFKHKRSRLAQQGKFEFKPTRPRNLLDPEQVTFLKGAFFTNASPSPEICESIAAELGLKPEQVTRWFSNERSRRRKKEGTSKHGSNGKHSHSHSHHNSSSNSNSNNSNNNPNNVLNIAVNVVGGTGVGNVNNVGNGVMVENGRGGLDHVENNVVNGNVVGHHHLILLDSAHDSLDDEHHHHVSSSTTTSSTRNSKSRTRNEHDDQYHKKKKQRKGNESSGNILDKQNVNVNPMDHVTAQNHLIFEQMHDHHHHHHGLDVDENNYDDGVPDDANDEDQEDDDQDEERMEDEEQDEEDEDENSENSHHLHHVEDDIIGSVDVHHHLHEGVDEDEQVHHHHHHHHHLHDDIHESLHHESSELDHVASLVDEHDQNMINAALAGDSLEPK